MRIGVISRGSPDYLIDVVMDGLVRLFGRSALSLDYNVRGELGGPYAHLLEGVEGPEPFPLEEADVLVASNRSLAEARHWMDRTGKRSVAIIDGEDDDTIREPWPSRVPVYFKREYIAGRRYPANVRPLPFGAIPEPKPEPSVVEPRAFVAFHVENHPFRRDVVQALSSMGFSPSPRTSTKREYNEMLARSLVGIAVRGGGWDTYRYWEIPYFGSVLLSQRPAIEIPQNFVEGLEATFFSSVHELKSKLQSLLANPERTREMARLGTKACEERHLSVNRARTVIEAVA